MMIRVALEFLMGKECLGSRYFSSKGGAGTLWFLYLTVL